MNLILQLVNLATPWQSIFISFAAFLLQGVVSGCSDRRGGPSRGDEFLLAQGKSMEAELSSLWWMLWVYATKVMALPWPWWERIPWSKSGSWRPDSPSYAGIMRDHDSEMVVSGAVRPVARDPPPTTTFWIKRKLLNFLLWKSVACLEKFSLLALKFCGGWPGYCCWNSASKPVCMVHQLLFPNILKLILFIEVFICCFHLWIGKKSSLYRHFLK